MRRRTILIVSDIVLVMLSFLLVARILPGKWEQIFPDYELPFLFFLSIWFLVSFFVKKYNLYKVNPSSLFVKRILVSNFLVVAVVSILFYGFGLYDYSRKLVFGVILLATFFEFVLFYLINAIITALRIEDQNGIADFSRERILMPKAKSPHVNKSSVQVSKSGDKSRNLGSILKLIQEENGNEVYDLIYNYVMEVKPDVRIVSTTTRFNIYALDKDQYGCIVNLHRINDIKRINKFFEAVNLKLYTGGLFIGKAETFVFRKSRIIHRFPLPFNYLFYTIDFIIKRIWPKIPLLNRLYFFLTGGNNRVISRAETLGRLYSCGFEVVEEKFINDELHFVVRKVKEPLFPEDPTYGPIIRLNRIGKDGKYFNVFKMRTMHPYAEYLQEYVYQLNSLQPGGKIKDDFRVTSLGKFMRKFWLDELPMFINVFRGEMKIVGVRPLSSHYFNLYTEELKEKRIKHKPGLIPPFYVDMPVTLEEIMASEMRYLKQHEKKPFMTDFKYFFKALKNILIKNVRSH